MGGRRRCWLLPTFCNFVGHKGNLSHRDNKAVWVHMGQRERKLLLLLLSGRGHRHNSGSDRNRVSTIANHTGLLVPSV